MKDVVIVSNWGRGAWLAHQLQQKAFRTTVFDVSALQPVLSSAEREGPFGVFLPSHLSDLQKHYLCGDNFYSIQQGFSVFTSQGPVEFRGPLNNFFMETWKDFQFSHSILNPEGLSSLSRGHVFANLAEALPLEKGKKLREFSNRISIPSSFSEDRFGFSDRKKARKVKGSIESNWLLCLAKEFANSYLEQSEPLHYKFSPLFSDYVLRESSQRYFSDLKYSLQKEGVEWIDVPSTDLSSPSNCLKDFEFKKTHVEFKWNEEIQKSRFLIWTLSGPETLQCFSNSLSVLFPKWEPPVKIWRRFSLFWDQGTFAKVIPLLLLILPEYIRRDTVLSGQEHIQNGEEAFLSLKHNPAAAKMDLWMLCPYVERFNESILSSYLEAALDRLNRLFPDFAIKGYLPEQEICHDYFVLYKKGDLLKKKSNNKKFQRRLFHLNPESTGKMDAYSLMQQSGYVLDDLLKKRAYI